MPFAIPMRLEKTATLMFGGIVCMIQITITICRFINGFRFITVARMRVRTARGVVERRVISFKKKHRQFLPVLLLKCMIFVNV